MKLQNLMIIFIIIILPIILIFSLYLNLETKTINLQTEYDGKLIAATKEAVEAFEINTTEWNNSFSSLANVKRQDLMSSVNVFTTSFASKMGISGTSKEEILTYVPAIVYVMYDGYYIYAPTYIPQTITNDNGVQLFYYEQSGSDGAKITASATQNINGTIVAGEPMYKGTGNTGSYNGNTISFTTDISKAEKTYKHILKTFVPYTTTYNIGSESYVINYTLDNYVRIYGENMSREGYIIEDSDSIVVPKNSISVEYKGNTIGVEKLEESVAIKNTQTKEVKIETYNYIYNSNNDKRYYDPTEGKFFTINKYNEKVYLPESEVGGTLAEYKKLLIRPFKDTAEYVELYQIINGKEVDDTWYYVNSYNEYLEYPSQNQINQIDKTQDCSAINYYVENYYFNKWLKNKKFDKEELLSQKKQNIIDNINNNLNLSISNYNANSKINYSMPELSDDDWEQALSNISMITFFQGVKIGLKTYNNYAVVTSTENNEYVSESSLYYLGTSNDDYYHRYGCSKGDPARQEAYRNVEFKVQQYTENDTVKYYYKHNKENGTLQECFDCIVNRNNYKERRRKEYI